MGQQLDMLEMEKREQYQKSWSALDHVVETNWCNLENIRVSVQADTRTAFLRFIC